MTGVTASTKEMDDVKWWLQGCITTFWNTGKCKTLIQSKSCAMKFGYEHILMLILDP